MKYFSTLFFVIVFSAQAFAQKNLSGADSVAAAVKATSLQQLHAELTKNLSSNNEKVRAFYVWITHNIAYDVYEFTHPSNNIEKQSAGTVLKNKKAVCHGYSDLFKALCDLSSIPCFMVSGYPKKNESLLNEGHTWNVVFVNDKWLPVDATWGAGAIDATPKFIRDFDESYFLTEPQKFIVDHYPFDPMWQLLTNPVPLKNYKKQGWKHSESGGAYYNYNDTIKNWLMNNEVQRSVLSAKRMITFNPEDRESKNELSFALIDWAYDESTKGSKILEELYPKKNNKQTTAVRKQLPKEEFNAKLNEALSNFNKADSILSTVKSVDRNQQMNIDDALKVYRYNKKMIADELKR